MQNTHLGTHLTCDVSSKLNSVGHDHKYKTPKSAGGDIQESIHMILSLAITFYKMQALIEPRLVSESHYEAKNGLKPPILLLQPLKY